MGPRTSHADVMRFLFEAAEGAIAAVSQAAQPSTILDSQVAPQTFEEDPSSDSGEEDPGAEPDERDEDSEGIDDAERDLDLAGDGEDTVMCSDSQIQRNVEEVIRTYPDATHGFWSKMKVLDFS
ncbi:hypothetical protein R1flu_023193 [Riccia fluitans]|uniref:Uncharacterized protein n=1 Tax=Riccia fluitans TaxID=41844 RepID=A0ABD1XUC2_9MARC